MTTAASLSPEQLTAFNDELAALARAGVPLERGLTALGRDYPGQLGRLASAISQRMERGESLQQLVHGEDAAFPPLYRAVISAGVRSGNLAAALEGLSETTRRMSESRRLVQVALLYPLTVLATAYGLFVFSVGWLVPQLLQSYAEFNLPAGWLVQALGFLHKTLAWWWFWPPLLVVLLLAWEAWSARRLRVSASAWRSPIQRLLRPSRLAAFADVLALLIEHGVPLPEALGLAADASGDRGLSRTAHALAENLQRGQRDFPEDFPALVRLALTTARSPSVLVTMLRRTAGDYRRRTRLRMQWLALYLPAILTALVGLVALLVETAAFLIPYFHLLRSLPP